MSETTQTSQQETSQISKEVTPAQETTTKTEGTAATESGKTETPKEEAWEYNGDRQAVPKEFQKYATGFDRYVSKKDQAHAEALKKYQDIEKQLNSEEFKAWQATRQNTGKTPNTPQPLVTQDEMDAIALGDTKTLEDVINRGIQKGLETNVKPQIEELQKEREANVRAKKERDAAEYISDFTNIHPDFKDLLESPAGEFMIEAARRGQDLESIYQSAKKAEEFFIQKEEKRRAADREAKKAGSVVGKSISGTPDVVFAENETEAKRLAISMTLKGDKRQVQIKQK